MENAPAPSQPAPASVVAQDSANLNTIGVLYYVLAAFTALAGLMPIIHVAMGIAMIVAEPQAPRPNQLDPASFGWFFVALGSFFILIGLSFAALCFALARRIRARRGHQFCVIGAGISCLIMPFGTVLGVF